MIFKVFFLSYNRQPHKVYLLRIKIKMILTFNNLNIIFVEIL